MQLEFTFFNILMEFKIPKNCCSRSKGIKSDESLRKIIILCSPYRLGTIVNESSEAMAKTRTGEQH